MPPLTGYEQRGDWTTIAEEAAFLAQVAAETHAVHTVGGTSRRDGHPLHRIDIGNPDGSTFLVVSTQHGDEPATREAALILARDLAYSTDPDVLAYLAAKRVVILPTVNPDGLPDSRSAGGRDINRDHFEMRRPEGRFVAATLAETRPVVLADCHEYEYPTNDAAGPDHLSSVSKFFGRSPSIEAAGADLHTTTRTMLTGQGWSNGVYATYSLGTLASAGSAWHAVSMLHESHRTLPLPERVDMTLAVLRHVMGRHRTESTFEDASTASREYARTTRDPYRLSTATSGFAEVTVDVAGYQLAGPLPPDFAVYGIEVDGNGFAPMRQDARPVIPVLLDPQSPYAAVSAARVPWPPDPDPPTGRGLRFADGTPVTLRRTDGTPVSL